MRIVTGSDHAGFTLKVELIAFLEGLGHTVEDKGDSILFAMLHQAFEKSARRATDALMTGVAMRCVGPGSASKLQLCYSAFVEEIETSTGHLNALDG